MMNRRAQALELIKRYTDCDDLIENTDINEENKSNALTLYKSSEPFSVLDLDFILHMPSHRTDTARSDNKNQFEETKETGNSNYEEIRGLIEKYANLDSASDLSRTNSALKSNNEDSSSQASSKQKSSRNIDTNREKSSTTPTKQSIYERSTKKRNETTKTDKHSNQKKSSNEKPKSRVKTANTSNRKHENIIESGFEHTKTRGKANKSKSSEQKLPNDSKRDDKKTRDARTAFGDIHQPDDELFQYSDTSETDSDSGKVRHKTTKEELGLVPVTGGGSHGQQIGETLDDSDSDSDSSADDTIKKKKGLGLVPVSGGGSHGQPIGETEDGSDTDSDSSTDDRIVKKKGLGLVPVSGGGSHGQPINEELSLVPISSGAHGQPVDDTLSTSDSDSDSDDSDASNNIFNENAHLIDIAQELFCNNRLSDVQRAWISAKAIEHASGSLAEPKPADGRSSSFKQLQNMEPKKYTQFSRLSALATSKTIDKWRTSSPA